LFLLIFLILMMITGMYGVSIFLFIILAVVLLLAFSQKDIEAILIHKKLNYAILFTSSLFIRKMNFLRFRDMNRALIEYHAGPKRGRVKALMIYKKRKNFIKIDYDDLVGGFQTIKKIYDYLGTFDVNIKENARHTDF
jgi:hypothetical protein